VGWLAERVPSAQTCSLSVGSARDYQAGKVRKRPNSPKIVADRCKAWRTCGHQCRHSGFHPCHISRTDEQMRDIESSLRSRGLGVRIPSGVLNARRWCAGAIAVVCCTCVAQLPTCRNLATSAHRLRNRRLWLFPLQIGTERNHEQRAFGRQYWHLSVGFRHHRRHPRVCAGFEASVPSAAAPPTLKDPVRKQKASRVKRTGTATKR
jgi:hypothetical protein